MQRFAGKLPKILSRSNVRSLSSEHVGETTSFSQATVLPSSLETRQWMLTLLFTGWLDFARFYSFPNS